MLPVFVYGTLMAGESNHHFMHGATLLGPASTLPAYTLFNFGPYPGMVPVGSHAIHGELYTISDAMLPALDHLEGHPDFYRRHTIVLADGVQAIAYLLRPDQVVGLPEIPTGDWRRR